MHALNFVSVPLSVKVSNIKGKKLNSNCNRLFSRRNAKASKPAYRCAAGEPTLSRKNFLLTCASIAAASFLVPFRAAQASRDYAGVGYLGGSDKVDINNANIRAYTKFPGLYPTLASMIVKNGPYKSVGDLYNIKGLTPEQKELIKKYEEHFVALEPAPEYVC
eukprot:ctg_138.g54